MTTALLIFTVGQAHAVLRGVAITPADAPTTVRLVDVASMRPGICSVTKIGAYTFLSTAHCVREIIEGQRIGLGPSLATVVAVDIMSGEELNGPSILAVVRDLGIVEIAEETPAIAIARLTPMNRERFQDTPTYIAGFGAGNEQIGEERALVAKAFQTRLPSLLLLSHPILFGGTLRSGYLAHGDSGSGVMRAARDRRGQWLPSDEILAVVTAVPSSSMRLLARRPLLPFMDFNRYHGIAVRLDDPVTRAWINQRIDRFSAQPQ